MKKKFVKVMLFGALALAATSTVTSCKDYDDDVANLQEQIDKITSTSPVSAEDMKAAISSAKSDLESQLATLKSNLENKDALISELNQKVADLEEKLKNTADKETVNQLTKDLTEAKNDLDALQKLQASDVEKLQGQIDDLSELVNTLNDLKDSFVTKEDLNDYLNSEAVKGIISDELKAALADNGKIASAINDAIRTQVLVKFGSLDDVAALAGENGTVAKVITDLYDAINNDKTGALARLVELEEYQKALEDKAKAEGFDNIEAVIAEVADLKASFSGIYASESFKNAVSAEVKAAIETQLGDATSSIGKLQKELQDLGVAINNMIQSVVYIPSTIDRSVDFYTLYAKKTTPGANYEVAAKSVDTQELKFRISPAVTMTAEEFNAKYDISLNSEERNWTRANAEEPFAVKAKDCKAGVLTVELTTTSSKSYAISLNIASKADEEGNKGLTPTNINSDYIAVIQSNYYLKTAYYKVGNQKAGEIVYDNAAAVDFSTVGTLKIQYATSASSSTLETATFSELNVANIFTTAYQLEGADKDLFAVSNEGEVSLKKDNEGLVDLIGKQATVKATVTSTYKLEAAPAGEANPATLGTVTIKRITKDLKYAFTAWDDAIWSYDQEQTKDLRSSDIYRDPAVNIPVADYQALTVKTNATTGVHFNVSTVPATKNDLTLVIPANTPAGDYVATVVFAKGDEYTLTITAPVKVTNPVVETLVLDPNLAQELLFTTELGSDGKPKSIILDYDLTKLFGNYTTVNNSLPTGGEIKLTIPNKDKFEGVDFQSPNLTIDKDNFKKKSGVTEDIALRAEVKLGNQVVQKIDASLAGKKISGSWKAGKTSVEVTDRTATINLADGFVWSDIRNKAMWENGTPVVGGDNFSSEATNGLSVYGLKAPVFSLVNSDDNKYVTVTPAGKFSFTEVGKNFPFAADPYEIKVKITVESQWGDVAGYGNETSIITVSVPK